MYCSVVPRARLLVTIIDSVLIVSGSKTPSTNQSLTEFVMVSYELRYYEFSNLCLRDLQVLA